MSVNEIGLIARARGLATHLLARHTLESLADAYELDTFARDFFRLGTAIDPIGQPLDVSAVERAVARTASRHLLTLYRWQERTPGVLDVFAARQDHRSLRALLRGAAAGTPSATRLDGLLPTPSLPLLALTELAKQTTPAGAVRQLVVLSHPDAARLLPLLEVAQADLFAVERALLVGFAERAIRLTARSDEVLREFVRMMLDVCNAQNALLMAGEPRDLDPADGFVPGGRLSATMFVSAAAAGTPERALRILAAAFDGSPLERMLPVVPSDVAHLDRSFLTVVLQRLARTARREPLSTAPVLRVLLLIEAQSRDLRALAWGAVLGAPPHLRKQQLVTPP